MAMKIRQPKKADVTALLRNLFLRTEQELIREITRKRAAGHVEYAEVAALDRVQKILQNMVDTSWSYVPVMIEKIFYHSDKDAAGYTNACRSSGNFGFLQYFRRAACLLSCSPRISARTHGRIQSHLLPLLLHPSLPVPPDSWSSFHRALLHVPQHTSASHFAGIP